MFIGNIELDGHPDPLLDRMMIHLSGYTEDENWILKPAR